jgi:ubiquitin-protein ligase
MPQYQVYFDTLEGEKRYDVDISEDESLELVLRDVLGELSERGHVMKGLAVGDLKVIWGGREGRELDLSRTLPEQGVRPNDVLRVLVEIYEGGGGRLRSDRIEKEWTLLSRLHGANPGQVEVLGQRQSPVEDEFRVRLHQSPGVEVLRSGTMVIRDTHTVRLCFPRYYPDQPIECYVTEPFFHPNVKPETGFVCLWEQANLHDTVIQALARMQAIAAYRMVNVGAVHVMNHEAAGWYDRVARPQRLVPLTWEELKVYEVRDGLVEWLEPGRRLGGAPRSRTH